jgi:primosomal protein N' (replication factor Y)
VQPSPDLLALPVARLVVDLPPAHLDRPFDYAVPDGMSATAVPGARVRVRFAGQDVDAFVLERLAASDHSGPLTPLRRVVSAEPVLTAEVARLARAVADRYAGTLPDVLRLALPPRHAVTERAAPATSAPRSPADRTLPPPAGGDVRSGGDHESSQAASGAGAWARYPAGAAFLARLATGEAPRAVWTALPGARHWADAVAQAAETVLAAGRGVVAVLPDRRDVDTLDQALLARLGPGRHARLEADLGVAERYKAFLACLRGQVRMAIGTRSAAFAPVHDVGLVVIWDDGDEQHAEPRAPYPHAREVLALRAEQAGAAMLLGGWSLSVEAASMLEQGWARPIEADRAVRRRCWARVAVADGDETTAPARIPTQAWLVIQKGLERGPVLVQVPLAGYVPAASCEACRRPARCPHCAGPVHLEADGVHCGWCARALPVWTCPHCQGRALRARRIGVHRTADELGRAFPGVPVVVSRPERDLPVIGHRPAIVLATAGVEPPVTAQGPGEGADEDGEAGYAAAVLLDGDLLLSRPDLRAGEEALRRWLAASALVCSASAGGSVVICAEPGAPAVQALVRGDPTSFAARELAERAELGLPPARATVSLVGQRSAVDALIGAADLSAVPGGVEILGPIVVEPEPVRSDGDLVLPVDEPRVRLVLRAAPSSGTALAHALKVAAVARSARKDRAPVRIQVDPRDVG